MKQGTQSQWSGTTTSLWDGVGREVGGGSAQGDTYIPMANLCYITNIITIL